MKITPNRINRFILFKLPLAYLSGMRVKSITDTTGVVKIKHRWINQNPFKSMFWAAQGMAAEMSTGVLVLKEIAASKKNVSMLVTNQTGTFTKKAVGLITFTCADGDLVKKAIQKSIQTQEGQIVLMTAEGVNEEGLVVCKFTFEWSLKVKK